MFVTDVLLKIEPRLVVADQGVKMVVCTRKAEKHQATCAGAPVVGRRMAFRYVVDAVLDDSYGVREAWECVRHPEHLDDEPGLKERSYQSCIGRGETDAGGGLPDGRH